MSLVRRIFLVFFIVLSIKGGSSNPHGLNLSIMAPDGSTFRKDYVYYPEAKGWLKYHRMPTTWYEAQETCHLEGARLASPINEGVSEAMKMLLKSRQSETIHTGVRAMVPKGKFFSEEGIHINDMPGTWAENEPNNLDGIEQCIAMYYCGDLMDVKCTTFHSFMCYKPKLGYMTMNECGTYDDKYVKNAKTGSCYKYHSEGATWNRAFKICAAEGAHLAVINSGTEAEVLKELVDPKRFTAIGFYKWDGNTTRDYWSTIDGKTLTEAGYASWASGEPNNLGGKELCGTFNARGLNDATCHSVYPFLCEIDTFVQNK